MKITFANPKTGQKIELDFEPDPKRHMILICTTEGKHRGATAAEVQQAASRRGFEVLRKN